MSELLGARGKKKFFENFSKKFFSKNFFQKKLQKIEFLKKAFFPKNVFDFFCFK